MDTIDVQNLVIVNLPDDQRKMSNKLDQKVKAVVEILKELNYLSTLMPSMVHRPWGTYTSLKDDSGCKVKRIVDGYRRT